MNPYQARLVAEVLGLVLLLRFVRPRGARAWILALFSLYLLSWESGGAFAKRTLPVGGVLVAALWIFSRSAALAPRAGWLILPATAAFVAAKYDPVQAALIAGAKTAGHPAAADRLASLFDLGFLGFSYLFLKYVHLALEVRRGAVADPPLGSFLSYFFFFPAFAAGPIDRWKRFASDGGESDLDGATRRIVVGAFQKFVLADGLGYLVDAWARQGDGLAAPKAWLLLYALAGRIYLDFAGYTSIAIGLGGLLGYRLPENFRAPYAQKNLVAFWQNWHITLTSWLRDYLFLPFGQWAMKRSWGRNQILVLTLGQLLTMLACGLWHGGTWGFVLWGLWHGAGLAIVQIFQLRIRAPERKALRERLASTPAWTYASHAATFHFVAFGWLLFHFPPHQAWGIVRRMIGL